MADQEARAIGIIDKVVHEVIEVIRQRHIGSIKERWNVVIDGSDLDILDDNTLSIIAKRIEEVSEWLIFQIRNCVKPIHVINKGMVKKAWVPINVASPDDMWQGLPFFISVRTHINVRQAAHNVDRVYISIESHDALQTTLYFDGTIVDIILIPL